MTDEKIHFLVAHEFAVSISLDGPKESHDRYRIYRNDRHPERRVGSFDIVMRNLMRFGELYPDYSRRSILMTLTSTVDWNSANDLLKTLKPYYTVSPSIVDKTESSAPAAGAGTGTKEAASSQCGGACGKQELYTLGDFSEKKNVVVYGSENGSGAAPEFDDWTEPRKACFEESRERFLEGLADAAEPEELNENFPLFYAHFRQTQRRLHLRQLRDHAPSGCFNCGCFPGVTRTFYNVHGELYPCEKTQNGRLFQLGDCTSGVQVERPKRLMEFIRLLGDCGNCIAKELCTKCPASIKELDGTGRPDALDYQKS